VQPVVRRFKQIIYSHGEERDIMDFVIAKIDDKIKSADCNNRDWTYWYQCGLHDAKEIILGYKCKKCGQYPEGQGGEYPCAKCGLPVVHDEA